MAASADGRRLVATLANSKTTLWRLQIPGSLKKVSAADPISLTTSTAFSPRLGQNYLLYVSTTGAGDNIWKFANGSSTELWSGEEARMLGGPAISPDGHLLAFSVSQHGQTLLFVMQPDGTNARIVADSLKLQGAPAWAPDGQSITAAADDHGVPHLFRIPIDGHSPTVSGSGLFAGSRVGARRALSLFIRDPTLALLLNLKAVSPEGAPHPLPPLQLTRGARRVVFLPGGKSFLVLRGEIQHKDLWLVDLDAGTERQLTDLPPDFDVRDFDLSPDGREVVLERIQERSDVVMLDLPRP